MKQTRFVEITQNCMIPTASIKQGMGEQARYVTHEQLEGVAGMRKEMESLQLGANNSLTLLKDMFKGQTVHKGKAQQNRRMKENSRRIKKNKEARFKVAAERLLEEITSIKILGTCFQYGIYMSVKAQSLYQVKLAVISKRSLASLQRKQQKNAAISLVVGGTLGSCGGSFAVPEILLNNRATWQTDVRAFVNHYSQDLPNVAGLTAELYLWERLWEEKRGQKTSLTRLPPL